MDILLELQDELLSPVSFLLLYVLLLLFAKWLKGKLSSFQLDEQLTEHDNIAVSISLVGYLLGFTILFIGALSGASKGFLQDLLNVGGYSLLGIGLLIFARFINDKLILYKFSLDKEMIEDHNAGVGTVLAASYISSALVIAGAIHGEGGGIVTTLIFFAIGQILLIVFALLYSFLIPYDLHKELEADNTAAGLGFSGGLIAIGIIVMEGVSGDFISWSENLLNLAWDLILIFVCLIFVHFLFDQLILNKSDINTEIAKDRNVGAGLLEMSMSIGFAVFLLFILS